MHTYSSYSKRISIVHCNEYVCMNAAPCFANSSIRTGNYSSETFWSAMIKLTGINLTKEEMARLGECSDHVFICCVLYNGDQIHKYGYKNTVTNIDSYMANTNVI